MSYNETKQHGTEDFPFELYELDKSHPRYEMAFHYHAAIEIIYVKSGRLFLTLNRKTVALTENDVAFVNSETIHGATPENCLYDCIVFNPAFLKPDNFYCSEFIDNLLNKSLFINDVIKDDEVLAIIKNIALSLKNKSEGFKFKVIGLFNILLYTIISKRYYTYEVADFSEKDERNVSKLKAVLEFIRKNYASEISLNDMADITGLSTKYFCSFFKSMTGKTPIDYLRAYRIEKACRMLTATDKPVTQIAYDCGFNDSSYFVKTFKEFKNTTPKKYRGGN